MGHLQRLVADGSWRCEESPGGLRTARFRWVTRAREAREATIEALAGRTIPEREWEAVLVEALLALPQATSLEGLELRITHVDDTLTRALAALVSRSRPALRNLVIATHPFDPDCRDPVDPRVPRATAAALPDALPRLSSLHLLGHGLIESLVSVDEAVAAQIEKEDPGGARREEKDDDE